MKNVTIKALTVCIILVALILAFTTGITASPQCPELGDANGDGIINMADVTTVERMIFGYTPLSTWADANWSGTVDAGDIVYIMRIIVGMSPIIHP